MEGGSSARGATPGAQLNRRFLDSAAAGSLWTARTRGRRARFGLQPEGRSRSHSGHRDSWRAKSEARRDLPTPHSSPSQLTCVTAFRSGLRYKESRKLGPSSRRIGQPGTFPVAPTPWGEIGRTRWLRHSSHPLESASTMCSSRRIFRVAPTSPSASDWTWRTDTARMRMSRSCCPPISSWLRVPKRTRPPRMWPTAICWN